MSKDNDNNNDKEADQIARIRALAQTVDWGLNENRKPGEPRLGFALFVFPFGHEAFAKMNYISTASRPDMIAALISFVDDYFVNKLKEEQSATPPRDQAEPEADANIVPFPSHKGPRRPQ